MTLETETQFRMHFRGVPPTGKATSHCKPPTCSLRVGRCVGLRVGGAATIVDEANVHGGVVADCPARRQFPLRCRDTTSCNTQSVPRFHLECRRMLSFSPSSRMTGLEHCRARHVSMQQQAVVLSHLIGLRVHHGCMCFMQLLVLGIWQRPAVLRLPGVEIVQQLARLCFFRLRPDAAAWMAARRRSRHKPRWAAALLRTKPCSTARRADVSMLMKRMCNSFALQAEHCTVQLTSAQLRSDEALTTKQHACFHHWARRNA